MTEPAEPASDFALLAAWRGGDERAGNELVRRHFKTLYRFFAPKVGDATADLMQRTLMTCVEIRDRVPPDVGFRAYLLGIARNKLLHHLRKAQREGVALAVEGRVSQVPEGSPSTMLGLRAQQRVLLAALRRLPIDLQITIELHFWEELKIREIAQVLEVAEGTVKSRLHRAKQALRVEIANVAAENTALRQSTLDDLEAWARSLRNAPMGEPEGAG